MKSKSKLPMLPLSVIIALVCFFYFTKPIWNEYNQTKEALAEEEAKLKVIKNSKDKMDQALTDYEGINMETRLLIKNAFPESLQEENFLKELNDAVVLSGVVMPKVEIDFRKEKLKRGESSDNIQTFVASLSLTGDYFGLKKMIYSLENMNRFARFETFLIEKNRCSDDLTLKLDLLFFYKSVDKLTFDSNSNYFKDLMKKGLEDDFINEYKNYRENVVNFSLIEVGEKGTDNLFGDLSRFVGSSEEIGNPDNTDNPENEEAISE